MQLKASELSLLEGEGCSDLEIIMDAKLKDEDIILLGNNIKGRIDFITSSTNCYPLPSKISLLMNNISVPVQISPTTWRSTIVQMEAIPLSIDENSLLNEEDISSGGGCDTLKEGEQAIEKKRACKNCSCGLKELNDASDQVKQIPQEPKSSCGSCYLGDAFRCSSCPYKGLPPFKEGEVVGLDASTFLEDDI